MPHHLLMSEGAAITKNPYHNHLQALIPTLPQKFNFNGTSAQCSNFFHPNTTCIRVFPTEDCYIKFGSDPTATSNDVFCPGGIIQYFGVSPDNDNKIAAIQSSTAGTLHIFEGL